MQHEFVDCIPDRLEEGVLYVSLPYATAVHKCACGCGHEVVTPFSPTDWWMAFNGEAVSLSPSIGNWSFPCRSHYWIERGRIVWAGEMPNEQIAAGRSRDARRKAAFYDVVETKSEDGQQKNDSKGPQKSRLRKFLKWLAS
jgi:hypothetical protein